MRAAGRAGGWASRRGRVAVALVLACVSLACQASPQPWSFGTVARDAYRQLDVEEAAQLREGVRLFEAGSLTAARGTFASLAGRAPGDVAAAVWQQEARVAALERGLAPGADPAALDGLRDRYRRLAEERPTPLAWYLAARLEEDPLAARLLLQKALELDPGMSWAHYALAHVAARAGDWGAARGELERTFELLPSHLPALRLYGWFLAEAGETGRAIDALQAWLERSDQDLLATDRLRDEVRLDLALAFNADGQESRAAELLRGLAPGDVDEVRRLTAIAVVEQGRDQISSALEAARAARRADPSALLPVVQEAMLLELWIDDPAAAREAWTEVLRLAMASDDLAAGLQRFRAAVHLERLERSLPEEDGR